MCHVYLNPFFLEMLLKALSLFVVFIYSIEAYPNRIPFCVIDQSTIQQTASAMGGSNSNLGFAVTTSKQAVAPGEKITVSIAGGSVAGLLLYAVSGTQQVGTFDAPTQAGFAIKTDNGCAGQSTIVHTSSSRGKQATFSWTAPTTPGPVAFKAFVVQSKTRWQVTTDLIITVSAGGSGPVSGNLTTTPAPGNGSSPNPGTTPAPVNNNQDAATCNEVAVLLRQIADLNQKLLQIQTQANCSPVQNALPAAPPQAQPANQTPAQGNGRSRRNRKDDEEDDD
jgi:hypothetical protein